MATCTEIKANNEMTPAIPFCGVRKSSTERQGPSVTKHLTAHRSASRHTHTQHSTHTTATRSVMVDGPHLTTAELDDVSGWLGRVGIDLHLQDHHATERDDPGLDAVHLVVQRVLALHVAKRTAHDTHTHTHTHTH